ncbi:MAG TPA: hypothetical protein VEG84_08495 [Thermoanaerobaculia bacterium]|nr:hypothetical protein [Thermoanaerobaculia bacterium]
MERFRLRFPARQLERWANRFSDPTGDELAREIGLQMKKRGYLTRTEFLDLCRWKTPRSRPHVERNSESFIRAVTRTALSTPDERLRIEVLTLLEGVDWPTASVILHFGHRDRYPVLDWRALWSLGVEKPSSYDFDFWWGYTRTCRRLAAKSGCTMRTLDRALWQYSKERHPQTAK